MNRSASSFRWSHRIVCWIFEKVTSGYRVRLDFRDGTQIFLGPENGEIEVAVRPPALWHAVWIFLKPGLRAGESFVRGDWAITQGDVATFLKMTQVPRRGLYVRLYHWISDWRGPIFYLRQRGLPKWNRRDVPIHYETGNEFYARMLGVTEQYSCAFFSLCRIDDLDAAQQAKIAISMERLHLTQCTLRVLDIGCGWGTLAIEIAKQRGNHEVSGITLSKSQLDRALTRCENLASDVSRRLNFYMEDYDTFLERSDECFDRIISIGMFEHVGLGRHRHFFRLLERGLRPGGRALVHSIVRPSPGAYNEWIRRYIFPGSFLPSVAEMIAAAEKANLIVDAIHLHPPSDYRKTIQAWRHRFERAWPALQRTSPEKYDEKFKRTWIFYLAGVETLFSEDLMNYRVAQVELRKMDGSINLVG